MLKIYYFFFEIGKLLVIEEEVNNVLLYFKIVFF